MDAPPINIAIIDDGINVELYGLGMLKHNIQVTPELQICERINYASFNPSHGTTCAAIIRKYSPNATLSSIKILSNESMRGMKEQLVEALKWCVKNNIRLINLSLGTVDFKDFNIIKAAVDYAYQNGIIIVAACNNKDIYTCPASLPNVIGVKCDITGTLKEGEFIYNSFEPAGIEITAFARHTLIKRSGEFETTSLCNSYAAPLVSALVYDILKENPTISFQKLKEELRKRAYKSYENQETSLLDINKELKNDIDSPIIAIYNYSNEYDWDVENKLCQLFRKDEYNAIYICNENYKEDICNGIISVESYIGNKENMFVKIIKQMYKIYNPDIIITSFNMTEKESPFQKELEESFDIDIKIFIVDDNYRNILDTQKNSIFILSNKSVTTDKNYGANTFIYLNESIIDKLYFYIIKLFEVSE